jgi:hypothetical protein
MRPLLEALATWQGPESVGLEIAKRGFFVPQAYREYMTAYCGTIGVVSDLETYWSERAREYVFCGGGVDYYRRRFQGDVAYRSAYLDRLAAEREALPEWRVPEIHPCLRRWIEESKRTKGQSTRSLAQKLAELKELERQRYDISGSGWTGKKRGVVPLLRSYAQSRGFEERLLPVRGFVGKGKAFCKKTPSGLIFYCWVDTGGFPESTQRLPLYFSACHVNDNYPPLTVGPDTMYVGVASYAAFETPELAVFGIFALVEIFDAFLSTFD